MRDVNVVRKRAGTTLSDDINKYLLLFLYGFLWPQFGNLIVTLCIGMFIYLESKSYCSFRHRHQTESERRRPPCCYFVCMYV
jgi:hypothetical protein